MLYLDSSAFIKNYWWEEGTEAVQKAFSRAPGLVSSIITLAEVEAAFGRLFREGTLSEKNWLQLRRQSGAIGRG